MTGIGQLLAHMVAVNTHRRCCFCWKPANWETNDGNISPVCDDCVKSERCKRWTDWREMWCADAYRELLASEADHGHTPNARGMPDSVEDLERAVVKMRELGVTKWNGIELGPAPAVPATDTDQPSGLTVDEAMRATRAERQRVASLASGGPVPAVGPKR